MTSCKGCLRYARQDFPVAKSCIFFDDNDEQLMGGNDTWICFVDGCSDHCCSNCYMNHIEAKHPKLYSTDCTECEKLTLYKQFVEYGVCKTCVDKRPVSDI